ncbi:hypothetical protein BHU72_05220 [Desulfuribacillus stibiiarsenatis]|uniref:NADP-dependent oxidoreductase domain-containing protein n=1 Tax=Desulfuribacillus stibiiarsenatis TaxID=1390249 RepID=A0A1E5L631_9FIRM|nr:aldo/keto reductase [Desulfuribacillus stibiiarsenatis]OEH85488.1 hypothetical protein BHU72_05220 [Desulfuribacillus stibiiarsenatis]
MEALLDKICLGTAQFGMRYGVANKSGQPNQKDIDSILDFSYNSGIRYLDTAEAYGQSEKCIGNFLRNNPSKNFSLVSKYSFESSINSCDTKQIPSMLEAKIQKSLDKLNIATIDGIMLHNPSDMYIDNVIEALITMKTKGYVSNIGVSVYTTTDALYAVNHPSIDCIQIPYNVLDRSLNSTHFFSIAAQKKVTVFARSIFLQGLLLMNSEEVPDALLGVNPYIQKLDELSNKLGIKRYELVLNYALANPGIDYIVIGIEHIDQLKKLYSTIRKIENCDFTGQVNQMEITNIDPRIVRPYMW